MRSKIKVGLILLLFVSNSCSKLKIDNKLTSAINNENVIGSPIFIYQNDSIRFVNKWYYKYILKNNVDNIEAYWGFKDDTLFCLKYTADINNPPYECLLKIPVFIKKNRTEKFYLPMDQCGKTYGAFSIMSVESNLKKSDSFDTLYKIKHTTFARPYLPDTIKNEKIRSYVYSLKHGFIEFESLNIGNTKNIIWWW